MRRATITAAILLAIAGTARARVAIEVIAPSASPGVIATIDVRLETDRSDVGGVGNDLGWSGPFSLASCRVNPAIERPATVFSYAPPGCELAGDCTSLRAIVLSLSVAPPIADGAVLYTCDVTVDAAATPGDYAVDCTAPDAGTVGGVPLAAECIDGVLTIAEPTPTASLPLPSPSATATPGQCAGDCDADGAVSIDDLVTAVRVALGAADASSCRAASIDGDAMVSIAELIRAVRAALAGC